MGPFTPGDSFWAQLLVFGEDHVSSQNIVRSSRPSRIGSESFVYEGGGGRRVGRFFS